jgi:hypothetical protein
MKDLGQLHRFLGMHIQRQSDGLLLSQHQYMLDILNRAGMADCKSCSTLRRLTFAASRGLCSTSP